MNDPFRVEGQFTFHRTQPREWKNIPFTNERTNYKTALHVVGIVLLWIGIFALSIWSISAQVPEHHIARNK